MRGYLRCGPQPSPHFSYSEINALPLNGQQAVTAISALWLRRSTAFRWLQQPIGRHLMIDVVEQVIERHQEVKNEGISEGRRASVSLAIESFYIKYSVEVRQKPHGDLKGVDRTKKRSSVDGSGRIPKGSTPCQSRPAAYLLWGVDRYVRMNLTC